MNRLGNWISGKSQTPFYARREFNIKKQVQKQPHMYAVSDSLFFISMDRKYLIMN